MRRARSSNSADPNEVRGAKLVRNHEVARQTTDNGISPAWSGAPSSSPRHRPHGSLRTFVGCSKRSNYIMEDKVGEGTFGEVHKAKDARTNKLVALKRIIMHKDGYGGIPITAIREIKILKQLKHKNVITLTDMVVEHGDGSSEKRCVYMVFPYMDHDLAGLLDNPYLRLETPHIKAYLKQLLEGTAYLHHNKILHRDMKAANLLINNDGILKIADFGLARGMEENGRYTQNVVTLWYRPPELILGKRDYTSAIDMWGVGCVFGELLRLRPIMRGKGEDDIDQLKRICALCGSPTEENMPGWEKLPDAPNFKFERTRRRVKEEFKEYGEAAADLLDKFLVLDSTKRITALDALEHDYFYTTPYPAHPKDLPKYNASHEYDRHRTKKPEPSRPTHAPYPQRNNHHGYSRSRHYDASKRGNNDRRAPRA